MTNATVSLMLLPVVDPVWMNAELTRQLGDRPLAKELLDQDGDARSEYEATEGSQPRSRSALPASGQDLLPKKT
jgi:hypothetical protein